jgi:hypothetical protein
MMTHNFRLAGETPEQIRALLALQHYQAGAAVERPPSSTTN